MHISEAEGEKNKEPRYRITHSKTKMHTIMCIHTHTHTLKGMWNKHDWLMNEVPRGYGMIEIDGQRISNTIQGLWIEDNPSFHFLSTPCNTRSSCFPVLSMVPESHQPSALSRPPPIPTPNPHPPFHFYWKSLSTPWHSRSPHPKPFNFSGCQQGSLWSGVVPTGQQQVGTSKSVHSIEFCAWESNIGYLKAKRRRSGGCILMGGSRNPLPCWLPQLP